MELSDLDNVISVGTICYQFGEPFLDVFLLHKLDNLLSVYILYQYSIILLSVLGTIRFSNLDEFSENFQIAFEPPHPRFGKLCCTFREIRISVTKFFG